MPGFPQRNYRLGFMALKHPTAKTLPYVALCSEILLVPVHDLPDSQPDGVLRHHGRVRDPRPHRRYRPLQLLLRLLVRIWGL